MVIILCFGFQAVFSWFCSHTVPELSWCSLCVPSAGFGTLTRRVMALGWCSGEPPSNLLLWPRRSST